MVLEADIQDRDAARHLLIQNIACFPRLRKIWADGGYRGLLVDWVKRFCRVNLDIILRPEATKAFVPLPRRWVVERTFAWFNHNRRLSKDYEYHLSSSEAMTYLSMIRLMLRRLACST